MDRKTKLTFVIGSEEAAWQEGTFTVSSSCSHLSLYHDLSEKYTFLVFLMLKDPKGEIRFLKQLGYSEPVISLGDTAENTTIGGIPGKIPEGVWKMEVFLFAEHLDRLLEGKRIPFSITISEEAAFITEHIGEEVWTRGKLLYENYDFRKVIRREARWYKGDLHTHTRLSDGKELPETASRKAERMGLAYYIPTEHNVLHTGWPRTEVLVLPGVEITTVLGHANLFGIDRKPEALEKILRDKDSTLLSQDLQEILKECKERGWLFSINHPFLYIWKWLYQDLLLSEADCLEILNDPTYAADPEAGAEEANRKAIFLSDLLWEDGYRICAIGGSDSHKKEDEFYPGATEPSIPGDPATFLYMEALSAEQILQALRNCRAYLTRHCQIESNLKFGERLKEGTNSFPYEIRLSGPEERPIIFYLQNGEKHVCEVSACGNRSWCAKGSIPLKENTYQWFRFGAEEADGSFLFYGNAITKGQKAHRFQTFGEIAEELERRWKGV